MRKIYVVRKILVICCLLCASILAKGDNKVKIFWAEKEAQVKCSLTDSVHVSVNGGHVEIKNKYKGRELTFLLSGSSSNGSLVYHGKKEAHFELKDLHLNSKDSTTLNFKNSKKTILKLSGSNTLTVDADTLDGALLRTKGSLHIKGKGSLDMNSSSVGCKGIKVGKDMVMDGGNINIVTSGMYVEVDTTSRMGGPMGPPPGMSEEGFANMPFPPMMHGGHPRPEMGDSFPPRPHFHGMMPGMERDSMFRMPEGDFPGPHDGFAGPPGKQKYNGSSKGVRVTGTITINGGSLNIKTSAPAAEGLEAKESIAINGGDISVDAYDDGINAGGAIVFAGGKVRVISQRNDAVDSNSMKEGAITISGGDIEVLSLAGNPEEGFDCDFAPIVVSGGRAIGIGGAMGPSPSAPNAETAQQPTVILHNLNLRKGSVLSIQNSKGSTILQYQAPSELRDCHILITNPAFNTSDEYKAIVDGDVIQEFNFKESKVSGAF